MENFLRGTFGEENRLAFRVFHEDRHHAPGEVERDLVELLILFRPPPAMEIGAIQDRPGPADS